MDENVVVRDGRRGGLNERRLADASNGQDDEPGSSDRGMSANTTTLSDESHMIKASQRFLVAELQCFGFGDWMDDAIYRKAQTIFFERAKAHGCIDKIPSLPATRASDSRGWPAGATKVRPEKSPPCSPAASSRRSTTRLGQSDRDLSRRRQA